ncbi:MAG: TonB-dependent receptor [Elusimicrobiota bacterium]|jgi:iron complex outermembrane receptor protein
MALFNCVLLLVLSFTAAAAEPLPAQARKAWLDTIVVTASRSPQPWREVVGRLEVLDNKDLSRSGTENLDQALRQASGVNAWRTYGDSSYHAFVSVRGLPASEQGRTLVLLDGVPVNTSATGTANFNRLDLAEIEAVEVLKGPGSYAYGGGALAGVIHVISKKPAKPLEARARVSYGTYDTRSAKASVSGRSNLGPGTVTWGISGQGLQSSGYISAPEAQRTAFTRPRFARASGLGAKVGWETGSSGLEFEFNRFDDLRGEGQTILAENGNNRAYSTDFWRLSWKGKAKGHAWRLDSHLQRQDYGRTTERLRTGNEYERIDVLADRSDLGVALAWTPPLFLSQSLTAGLDFRLGKVDSHDHYRTAPYSSIDNRGQMSLLSFFLQDELSFQDGRLKAFAAARIDQARFFDGNYFNPTNSGWVGLNGPLSGRAWNAYTGKAGLRFLPSQRWSVYASLGRGFRPPTLEDMCLSLLRSNQVSQGNPDLDPETLDSYEFGGDWTEEGWLRVSPSLFFTQGRDFIYSVNTGRTVNISGIKPIYQRQNVARVDIYGAELDARVAPVERVSFSAAVSAHQSRIRRFSSNAALEGRTLANTPAHAATLSAEWAHPWLGMSLWWAYKDKQYQDDANYLTSPSHSLLSVRLWKDFGPHLQASFVAENLGDVRYQESPSELSPGISVKGSLSAKF